MDQFQHSFMDPALLSHSHPTGNMFMDDYELYPQHPTNTHQITERAAQFQYQLSEFEDSVKGQNARELTPYTPWTDKPVSTYVGFPGAGMNPCLPTPGPGSDYAASPWSADWSSASDAASPRNDWRTLDYTCYPSPPYIYDEPVMSQVELGGFPSADDLLESSQSVALCQVQHYPDPDLGVKLDLEPTMHVPPYPTGPVKVNTLPYDDFESISSASSQTNTTSPETTPDTDLNLTRHSISQSLLPTKTPISRRGKSGRPTGNRITKRQSSRTSSKSSCSQSTDSNPRDQPKTFTCSFSHYGCASSFVSKNEWKRHVQSQHLQLGFYRCDLGSCNATNPKSKPSRNGIDTSRIANDFNRKDLFTQHQRRMHAPWIVRGDKCQSSEEEKNIFEQSLEDVRARCWVEQRKPPGQSQCGFCGRVFCGPTSWDERMEHVGRHFEKDGFLGDEVEDLELRKWAVEEGIVRLVNGRWRLASLAEV